MDSPGSGLSMTGVLLEYIFRVSCIWKWSCSHVLGLSYTVNWKLVKWWQLGHLFQSSFLIQTEMLIKMYCKNIAEHKKNQGCEKVVFLCFCFVFDLPPGNKSLNLPYYLLNFNLLLLADSIFLGCTLLLYLLSNMSLPHPPKPCTQFWGKKCQTFLGEGADK